VKAFLLLQLVVTAIVVLVRFRGWQVAHYPRAARRAHFVVCIGLALVAASATVYQLQDAILCPSGYATADLVRDPVESQRRGRSRSRGMMLICRDDDGDTADGSIFAGVFAWLALVSWTFIGSSAVWRTFGPKAPPRPAKSPTEPGPGTPTDRKDRRKERNLAKRDAERRGDRR